jgi:hypothetical protein
VFLVLWNRPSAGIHGDDFGHSEGQFRSSAAGSQGGCPEPDNNGHYSAVSQTPGSYRVTVTQEGFQTEVRAGIVLTVAREDVVDLSLMFGSVAQTVQVTGQPPLVESTTASLGSLGDDRTGYAILDSIRSVCSHQL